MENMVKQKKVLITGYSGFIGSSLTKELLDRGYIIYGVSSKTELSYHPNLIQLHVNLLDDKEVKDFFTCNQFDTLIHLAWYLGPKCHISNINMDWLRASLLLLQEFKRSGGKCFISTGTVSEYDFSYGFLSEQKTPLRNSSLHGVVKSCFYRMAESYCKQNNIEFKWPRVFNLFGPKEKPKRLVPYVINSMLQNKDVLVSSCQKFQDFLFVEDTASAIAQVLESDFTGAINICSGIPIKLEYIVNKIKDIIGYEGNIYWGAIPASFDDTIIVGDNSLLLNYLHWKPKYSFEQGLIKTINWWRNEYV